MLTSTHNYNKNGDDLGMVVLVSQLTKLVKSVVMSVSRYMDYDDGSYKLLEYT